MFLILGWFWSGARECSEGNPLSCGVFRSCFSVAHVVWDLRRVGVREPVVVPLPWLVWCLRGIKFQPLAECEPGEWGKDRVRQALVSKRNNFDKI